MTEQSMYLFPMVAVALPKAGLSVKEGHTKKPPMVAGTNDAPDARGASGGLGGGLKVAGAATVSAVAVATNKPPQVPEKQDTVTFSTKLVVSEFAKYVKGAT